MNLGQEPINLPRAVRGLNLINQYFGELLTPAIYIIKYKRSASTYMACN